jgi:predicted metal-dependent HD superfamily phosphohydrolase
MLANFDAQAREECIANRVVSNTPQQALTLLNDPEFVEAARVFAQHLLTDSALSDEARLDQAYERALARPTRPNERDAMLRFLAAQREHFRANQADAEKLVQAGIAPSAGFDIVEHAAWMSVARVILNLHEAITRY